MDFFSLDLWLYLADMLAPMSGRWLMYMFLFGIIQMNFGVGSSSALDGIVIIRVQGPLLVDQISVCANCLCINYP